MKRAILPLAILLLPLAFNGCSKEVQIKYIKLPCPKLKTINKKIEQPKDVQLHIYPLKD